MRIKLARVIKGVFYGERRDFMEDDPKNFFILEHPVFDLPADRFAFPVRVGRYVYRFCIFGFFFYDSKDFSPAGKDYVRRLEVFLDINAQFFLGRSMRCPMEETT